MTAGHLEVFFSWHDVGKRRAKADPVVFEEAQDEFDLSL